MCPKKGIIKMEEKLRSPERIVLDNGNIFLYGEIASCVCEDIISCLTYLYLRKVDPIRVYVGSPGGSIWYGIAIYDYIRTLVDARVQIYTIGQGHVASMGGVLLQAGSTRIMQKNAFLMIHEISGLSGGRTAEKEDEIKLCKRIQEEVILEILSERSSLSKTEIKRKWLRKDWWMSAGEALELGFVDQVV